MPPVRTVTAVATPEARSSGLTPVPEVHWGGHVSAFFGSAEDLFEMVADFVQAGIAGHEKSLWVTSDPFTVDEAMEKLAQLVPDFEQHVASGAVEILEGAKWYLTNDELNVEKVIRGWRYAAAEALRRGFDGIRIVGNAFWLQNKYWRSFREYEAHLSDAIRDQRMIVLCVYPLAEASAADVLDITKAHDFSIVRREGQWEFLESPEQAIARREIDRLQQALDILSLPFPGRGKLTPRERLTLAQIVRGASNKEAARALKISPRTVEFHRANIMRKLDVHNVAELISLVLSAAEDPQAGAASERRASTGGARSDE